MSCRWQGSYKATEYLSLKSFNKFKNAYTTFIESINNECDFIKINNPTVWGEKSFEISLNHESAVKTPEDYIILWKFFSTIPTLKRVCQESGVREGIYEYDTCFDTTSNKLTFPFLTYCNDTTPHYRYVHLIKEESTYFIKFEFQSKLSDYNDDNPFVSLKDGTVIHTPIEDYIEWDRHELGTEYLFNDLIDGYELTCSIKDGVVSYFIIFELGNFNKEFRVDNFLLNAPFNMFHDSEPIRC